MARGSARWALLLCFAAGCRLFDRADRGTGAAPWAEVRGWSLLSPSLEDAEAVLARAPAYGINHLQLSHQLVWELREARRPEKQELVRRLSGAAHRAGIPEVVMWDRAFYPLDHYPPQFRKGGTLDLDDPAFWTWLKQDYREMLDRVPAIDGLVLTFVETGARVWDQRSARLRTGAEKLAALVDAVADVVVGERGKRLYARSFAYTRAEYDLILGGLRRISRPQVRLMMKDAPHDFFLTHPLDPAIGAVARPTLVELDPAGGFNGQGQIANTWPEVMLRRWGELQRRPHVAGYVARVDHGGGSRIVGRPSEILLWALKRQTEEPAVTVETVYQEFIRARYGPGALPHLQAAFQTAHDVVSSALYTLGTCTTRVSALDYDAYEQNWGRHVSGKWLDPSEVQVPHGVGRRFHYWKDIVDHLAPARFKGADGPLKREAPWVLERGWVVPEERMTEGFLALVTAEKTFGVARAGEALRHVEAARDDLPPEVFDDLLDHFQRTWLTARLHRAVASAYFGYRVWARGPDHRTATLVRLVREALGEIPGIVDEIRKHPGKLRAGGWKWSTDAAKAMEYYEKITSKGWPDYGGEVFPLTEK